MPRPAVKQGTKCYKWCPRCSRRFRRHQHHKSYCPACHKSYNKLHQRGWRQSKRQRLHTLILDYLAEHACDGCGETDALVLEFHHQGTKDTEVSRLLRNLVSPARLQRELDACTVLCANCHRRQTAKDQQHYRWAAMKKKPTLARGKARAISLIEVDWNAIAVRTRTGTVLRGLTMSAIEADLDKWLFYQRTGVNIVEKIIVTYNSISRELGLDPENKGDFSDKDKKKILDALENDARFGLIAWLTKKQQVRGATEVDTDFEAEATGLVHVIFDGYAKENETKFSRLATLYETNQKEADEPDYIEEQLRAFLKKHGEVYSVGAGPNPQVRRLKKPGKGNKMATTGLAAFPPPATRAGVKNKPKSNGAAGKEEE